MTVKRPRSKIIGAVVGATALGTVCQFLGGTPALAASPAASSNAAKSVIVVLHDQLAARPPTGSRQRPPAQATSSRTR